MGRRRSSTRSYRIRTILEQRSRQVLLQWCNVLRLEVEFLNFVEIHYRLAISSQQLEEGSGSRLAEHTGALVDLLQRFDVQRF